MVYNQTYTISKQILPEQLLTNSSSTEYVMELIAECFAHEMRDYLKDYVITKDEVLEFRLLIKPREGIRHED